MRQKGKLTVDLNGGWLKLTAEECGLLGTEDDAIKSP